MANTTKMQKALNAAESVIDAKADEVMAELTLITSALPALRQSVEDATDGIGPVSDVWSRINKGEDVSPVDLITAEAQEKIDAKRLGYLTKRQNVLQKSLPVDTLILADKTAAVLRQVMQGFDVYVTKAPAGTFEFPENTTAIVVIAEGPLERAPYTGLVSGGVKVLFHRPGHFRPINVEAVEYAAKAERLSLNVLSNRMGDQDAGWTNGVKEAPRDFNAFVTDVLAIRLESVVDGHAVIPRIDLSGLHSRTWVEEVLRANGSHPAGVPGTDKPYLWGVQVGRHTVATGWDPEIVSEDIDENGIRTLVVRQKINTMAVDPGDFFPMFKEAIAIDHGFTYKGLGVLTDSKVEAGASVDVRASANNWTVTLTFESKVA